MSARRPRFLKGAVRPPDNDSAFLLHPHRRAVPQAETMRRFRDEDEVDHVVVGEATHRLRLRNGAPVRMQEEGGIVVRRPHGALEEMPRPHRSTPRSPTSRTGSTSNCSSPSQLSRIPMPSRA